MMSQSWKFGEDLTQLSLNLVKILAKNSEKNILAAILEDFLTGKEKN